MGSKGGFISGWVESPGMVPETTPATGTTSKENLVRNSSLVAPFPPRVGKPWNCTRTILKSQSHWGETGCTHAHSWQHTLAGEVVAGREIARLWSEFWLYLKLGKEDCP